MWRGRCDLAVRHHTYTRCWAVKHGRREYVKFFGSNFQGDRYEKSGCLRTGGIHMREGGGDAHKRWPDLRSCGFYTHCANASILRHNMRHVHVIIIIILIRIAMLALPASAGEAGQATSDNSRSRGGVRSVTGAAPQNACPTRVRASCPR